MIVEIEARDGQKAKLAATPMVKSSRERLLLQLVTRL
jgi:hypothetical protein